MKNHYGLLYNFQNNLTYPLIFVVGPTCIGKSKFATKLAKKLKGEIINADSMQVYSNLNILTARPSKEDLKLIPHHMYGYVCGSKRYNVANWCNDISKIIEKNNKKNIYSIIVGGTGMYIEKLLKGLVQMPSIPEEIKKESEKLLFSNGLDNFFNIVKNIDEESTNRILKNDSSRLRRIWEVYEYTNNTFSYWLKKKNKKYIKDQSYKIFLFTPDRNKIYENVNSRFVKMIKSGSVEEVKKLLLLKLDKSLPIMRAHGVPEISDFLSRKIDIDQCITKGQQVTRNYAKRQLTWWRSSSLEINNSYSQFPYEIDINSINFNKI